MVNISQESIHRLILHMPLHQAADIVHDWTASFVMPQSIDHDTAMLSVRHTEREEARYFFTYNTYSTDPKLHFAILNDHELQHGIISMDYRVWHMPPV